MTGPRKPPSRLRRYREARRLTLRKVELLTGIGESYLSKLERGLVTPNGITRERLAEVYGVSRDELFPEDAEVAS